jgi:prophage maintenance system killer protein
MANLAERSDYIATFRYVDGRQFLMIEDLNKGRMSVTNNIENIVDYVCMNKLQNPCEVYIVYKDSEGMWDGYEFASLHFIPLQKRHWLSAAKQMLQG